jgi:uncharacterized protein (TIGR02246 family)
MFNYRVFLALFILFIFSNSLTSQKKGLILQLPKQKTQKTQPNLSDSDDDLEIKKVQKVIEDLFDAMRISRGTNVSHLFESGATLSSVSTSQLGQTRLQNSSIQGFIDAIKKPRTDQWDEKIWDYDIKVDGPLAQAWTPYSFYVNGQLSHCGVNNFELVKQSGQWKINRIIDTRRKLNCTMDPTDAINKLMDNWHKAAADANENLFFNSMTDDGVYVGTDASERWTKEEMRQWAKPYFDRRSAWNFVAKSRNISFSDDGNMAWADEVLDTWMGDCRSSVVLIKNEQEWKIKYFHVAIAVPNNAVDRYLQIIGKKR